MPFTLDLLSRQCLSRDTPKFGIGYEDKPPTIYNYSDLQSHATVMKSSTDVDNNSTMILYL